MSAESRRFRTSEIEKAIRQWKIHGRWSDAHLSQTNRYDPWGTNTVNPVTGCWVEHLLNPWRLCELLNTDGFSAKARLGLYGDHDRGGNTSPQISNAVVEPIGPVGISIAAYYALVGRR